MLEKSRKGIAKIIYPKAFQKSYFTSPVLIKEDGDYSLNERIIEWVYIFSKIEVSDEVKKILDFGCTNSWISLSLAAYGNDVHSIDLRDYSFKHKNITFSKINILNYNEKDFDIVIALSTLEHIGLGAYGEEYNPFALKTVLQKINNILKINGRFILTLPVGESSVNPFFISFTPKEIKKIVKENSFKLEDESYFFRTEYKYWNKCAEEEILKVSNERSLLRRDGVTGINGLGCFVFRKMED